MAWLLWERPPLVARKMEKRRNRKVGRLAKKFNLCDCLVKFWAALAAGDAGSAMPAVQSPKKTKPKAKYEFRDLGFAFLGSNQKGIT